MKKPHWLLGCCAVLCAIPFIFVGFWSWARDDFFPSKLLLSAPLQGQNEVAVVSESDMQGDANHSIRVFVGQKWRKWTDVSTQSEMADQKWQLLWSRDGSLLALKQSPGMMGDPNIKKPLYTHAFDFSKNKRYQSLDSWKEMPHSPFSRLIETMMQKRGGADLGRQTKREVGVWRWEDRDLKDAL